MWKDTYKDHVQNNTLCLPNNHYIQAKFDINPEHSLLCRLLHCFSTFKCRHAIILKMPCLLLHQEAPLASPTTKPWPNLVIKKNQLWKISCPSTFVLTPANRIKTIKSSKNTKFLWICIFTDCFLELGVILHINIHNMWRGERNPHLREPPHGRGITLDVLSLLKQSPWSCSAPLSWNPAV